MILSETDRDLIKSLRVDGILADVEGHLLDQKNGIIFLTCSDGDQFPEIFKYQAEMQRAQSIHERIHVLAWHGGALACAPLSPVNIRKRADKIFIEQIGAAREMKGINTVALYTHAPCGAADKVKLTVRQILWLQIRAKEEIKKLNQGIKVALFFHADYDNGKKRTYFLSQEKWDTWWYSHR